MPTFYTDPSITSRGYQQPDLLDTWGRLMQIRAMADQRRYRKLQEEEANLRLQELRRISGEQGAMRGAMAAGVTQAPQINNQVPSDILGGNVPLMKNPPQPAIEFDRQAALEKLRQSDPSLVPGMQGQFAAQDFTQREQQLKLAGEMAKAKKEQVDAIAKQMDLAGSLAQSVLEAPPEGRAARYAQALQLAQQYGLPGLDNAPQQYSPELDSQLEGMARNAMGVKEAATLSETIRHNKATEGKQNLSDFEQAFQRENGRLPTATEMEQHKSRIAREGRAEPGSFMPLTDEQGRVIGAWNPKSGRIEPIPGSFEGARKSGLSGTEISRRGLLTNLVEDMKTATTLAEKYRGTWTIGAGTGTVMSWGRRVVGGEQEAISLGRILGNAADILLRARSGAQINEQEYNRLSKLVPSLNESEDSFFTKLADFQNELGRMQTKTTATPAPKATQGPAVGTVEGGYRFKGGNPADQKNWEKVN